MTDYECPDCGGGFPSADADGACPWCGETMASDESEDRRPRFDSVGVACTGTTTAPVAARVAAGSQRDELNELVEDRFK